MNETSLSLLNRLRHSPESESWNRLVDLYAPLIRTWLRKYDVQESDAEDLVQEVLLAVSKDVASFQHQGRPGAFRAWLKGILVNRLRNFWRTRDRRHETDGRDNMEQRLAELESPTSELTRLWNNEHDRYVLRELLKLAKPHFAENTWMAFDRVALKGESPRDVAADLNISLNAVVTAKSRVLRRLRQEADGLVDSYSGFMADS
ncbi:RNA polymerase sigma factor [Bremerella sp. P1]|uniref:RNA polymerase sigma factor n=1 Tax=Bremerella sp. P1 TaxID=3026424 RepID=UPI0023674D6C|nr:sigma-70 family RNA polymerase sigma factor [Bremerella sp. P1]WDI42249.1 sigma-70 family RNA polymerase sigma factor [Bremerella sp. P1]